MSDRPSWSPQTSHIPTAPGVYRFRDGDHRVIYVGKAKSLRARLGSYFRDAHSLHPRTRLMLATAQGVEWTTVHNELEALQLEYTWIKEYDPRFNVKYRDDKSYPWLCVTWSDDYPRVFVGRGTHKKGWRYFGPYAHAWAIRDSIDTLLTVFPMRSCAPGVFRSAGSSRRPCLLAHIDKCAAPCVGHISMEAHRNLVRDFCSVIAGKSAPVIKDLQASMADYAETMEYEKAGKVRDKVEALQRVMEKNSVVLDETADVDVIALALDPLEVAVQLFHVRSGRILSQRGWIADRPGGDDSDQGQSSEDLPQLVEAFLLQIYTSLDGDQQERTRIIPPEILVPCLPESTLILEKFLSGFRGSTVRIKVPQRGKKKALTETAQTNATGALALHKTRRASDLTTRNQALDELAQVLEMDEVPLRIEGYDISHVQGAHTVASMVVFEDGLARTSEYRHFTITTVQSDDVGAMREVLHRRFSRLIDEREVMATDPQGLVDASTRRTKRFSYAPGLIVVDGAGAQARIARRVLDDLGFGHIVVVGLAKRLEEVWIPGREFPLILKRNSVALYLLQRIRDESHRFAVTFHRSKRSRAMTESLLDCVTGLGEVRRKALMKAFPSLKKLRAATAQEIAQVPGFGMKLAQGVVQAVAEKPEAINMTTGEVLD
ncbi:MAG: excinuclease ABC subunit UvrC [Propionibacteriaceae bacterium]|nr:excinuclease ABC subunit UvrC [Propionibacteriaceae bacterium]